MFFMQIARPPGALAFGTEGDFEMVVFLIVGGRQAQKFECSKTATRFSIGLGRAKKVARVNDYCQREQAWQVILDGSFSSGLAV
jgi:hypothetical protein